MANYGTKCLMKLLIFIKNYFRHHIMKNTNINLSTFFDQWLESKKQRMSNLLKIATPDEALYREIMLSLGYPKNKINFLELALILPYSEIQKLKEKNTIAEALLYRAGLSNNKSNLPDSFDLSLRMDKSVWIYRGIRPINYPEKRIRGISELLSLSIKIGLVNFFIENTRKEIKNKNPKSALKRIMNFQGIGIQRKEEMFFNIIIPFLLVFDCEKEIKDFLFLFFSKYPPLYENTIIKTFKQKNPNTKIQNAKEYMGVIYFIKNSLFFEK